MKLAVGATRAALACALLASAAASVPGTRSVVADEPVDVGVASSRWADGVPKLTEEEFSGVLRTRAALGVTTQEEAVRGLASSESAWDRGAGLGVPLAEDEVAGIAERLSVQDDTADVDAIALDRLGSTYAGTWADTAVGVNVVASTAAVPETLLGEFDARFDGRVEIEIVDHSLEELRRSEAQMLALRDRDEVGVEVVEASVYPMENRVRVALLAPFDGGAEALAQLTGIDPDTLIVQVVAERGNEESAPLGGHALQPDCSSGLHVYRGARTITNSYLVTAGHCELLTIFRHRNGGIPGAAGHDPAYRLLSPLDRVDYLGIDAQILKGDTPQPTRTIESWHLSQDFVRSGVVSEFGTYDQIGHWVCQSGAETAGVNNCGQIHSIGNCLDNFLVRKVPYNSRGGDSGGAVYGFVFGSYSVPIAGIHTGNCSTGPGDFNKGYIFQGYIISHFGLSGWW